MPPFPRHQLIHSDLVRRLQAREWQVGAKFPTVDEFMKDYDLSRGTIFKGIQSLVQDGYLTVRKGVGTFVARTTPAIGIGLLMNESSLRPQQTPYPYVLGQKLVHALEADGFSVERYLERKGTEFMGRLDIGGLANDLRRRSLRGMVMANCDYTMLLDRCPTWREFGVPFVTINTIGKSDFRIDFDSQEMMRLAFRCFADQGRRNVGLISAKELLPKAEEILSSFPELRLRREWTLPLSFQPTPERSGYELMRKLWGQKNRPDALFVSDDIVTKGVSQAAVQLGVRVPEDLLITHQANSGTDVFYPIRMPRIEYDLDETAREALILLKQAMADWPTAPKDTAVKKIAPRLITADAEENPD